MTTLSKLMSKPQIHDTGESAGCRLCHSESSKCVGHFEGYSVYRCRDCGFVFSDLAEDEIPQLYDEQYFHEEFGPYFAAGFGNEGSKILTEKFSEYADALEKVSKPGTVLDVGCAGGLFLDLLHQRGWKAEGVELSPCAAEVAARNRGVKVHVGDFLHLDLGSASFDAMAMLDVLEHFPDPAASLRRTRHLLKPKGVLLLVLPNYENMTTLLAMLAYRMSLGVVSYAASRVHQIYHVSYFTPKTMTDLLHREGFEVLGVRPDETVQELLNESPVVRLAVKAVFGLSRLLGLQNKMIVLAARSEEMERCR